MATNNSTNDGTRTAHGIFVAQGVSTPNYLLLTNGQVLIGSTGVDPVPATLTAGAGINIANAAGTITITNTGASFAWTTVTGTTQAITAENGYVSNNAGVVTFTLPAVAALGDTFIIKGLGAGGWAIAQNAGQLIHLGNQVTTTGVGGSLASTNQYDQITVTCIVANTTWTAEPVGNITYV